MRLVIRDAFVSCTLAVPLQLGLDQEHTVQQQSELNMSIWTDHQVVVSTQSFE